MDNFQQEALKDCLDEARPLLLEHWKEISHYPDIPLDPDENKYYSSEGAGLLRVYTARDEANKIIGYAVFFVCTSAHYKNSLQAMQDIIYVDPKHRGMGGRFILWCDRQLKAEGVQVVFQHIKAKHNYGRMLERFGYELIDLIYGRRLDR